MVYNWQSSSWPQFRYDLKAVEDALFVFAEKAGRIGGLMAGLPDKAQQDAVLDLMVAEAIKTARIEGEDLLRSDVMSSIRNTLGLNPLPEKVGDKRVPGLGALLVDVRTTFAEPLSEAMLFRWHAMLLGPFSRRMTVGAWRDHAEPMQIVSGPYERKKVHFEAPPSAAVPAEMERFIRWFNDTAPDGPDAIKPPPIRTALVHLYFESIHPFEDGNGRIGRALSEKALSQGLGRPVFMSLSRSIEAKRKRYYAALQEAQSAEDVTPWLAYFVETTLDAQEDAERRIRFILFKARLFDRFRGQMNARQAKAVGRMLESGPEGFEGGMRTQKYMKITGASKATTVRDLHYLVKIGLLRQIGEGRSTRYEIREDF